MANAIFRALASDPQARFPSVNAFCEAVETAARTGSAGKTTALPVGMPATAVLSTSAPPVPAALPPTSVLPTTMPGPAAPVAQPRSGNALAGIQVRASGARRKLHAPAAEVSNTRRNLLIGGTVLGLGGAGFAVGMKLSAAQQLLRVGYERNSLDVRAAVDAMAAKGKDIQAVVMVATYRAAARFTDGLRQKGQEKLFANVSFVDSEALAEELREIGPAPKELIVTQVVPHSTAQASGVIKYRETLARFFLEETPGFVSLEGYIVGCLMVEALKRCKKFEREELVTVLEQIKDLDLGIGAKLNFGPHEGSNKV